MGGHHGYPRSMHDFVQFVGRLGRSTDKIATAVILHPPAKGLKQLVLGLDGIEVKAEPQNEPLSANRFPSQRGVQPHALSNLPSHQKPIL